MTDLASTDVSALNAAVAREMEAALPALTEMMVAHFVELIPDLREHDDDTLELLAASAQSNLVAGVGIFGHDIPVDQVEVPAAAAHYARRMAQRDIAVESLLRAYRLGSALFLQWWLGEVEKHQPSAEVLLTAVKQTSTRLTAYIDRISVMLVEIYDEERKLWAQRAAATRAAAVRSVLLDENLEVSAAEALTGYRMNGVHRAFVVWSTAPASGRAVEGTARLLAQISGRAPLAVLADDRTLWAWVSGPSVAELDLARLDAELRQRQPPIRVAVGNPSSGLTGFRASHADALRAQHVTNIAGERSGGVTAFADVAVASFLAQDLDAARRWVADVLGDLANDDEGMAELRRTVLAFRRTGGSLTEAASQLHVHKNTVRYRLRKAEDILGRPIYDRRLDLETALLACAHLGRAVLVRTGL